MIRDVSRLESQRTKDVADTEAFVDAPLNHRAIVRDNGDAGRTFRLTLRSHVVTIPLGTKICS